MVLEDRFLYKRGVTGIALFSFLFSISGVDGSISSKEVPQDVNRLMDVATQDDVIVDPSCLMALEVYNGTGCDCVFISIAAGVKIANRRPMLGEQTELKIGRPVVEVFYREVEEIRSNCGTAIESLIRISRHLFTEIAFDDARGIRRVGSYPYGIKNFDEGEELTMEDFIRVSHSKLLSERYHGLREKRRKLLEKGISLKGDNVFEKEWKAFVEGKEFKDVMDDLLEIMTILCERSRQSDQVVEYDPKRWDVAAKISSDGIGRGSFGLTKGLMEVMGIVESSLWKGKFGDNYSVRIFEADPIDGGAGRRSPSVPGEIYMVPLSNHFQSGSFWKRELNLLSTGMYRQRVEGGKTVSYFVGHMRPLVKKENYCCVVFKTEKENPHDIVSFPCQVTISGENSEDKLVDQIMFEARTRTDINADDVRFSLRLSKEKEQ